jgi:hypothetical protein
MDQMRKRPAFFLLCFCLPVICLPTILMADPLDNWNWLNPIPQHNDLYRTAYGNGTYVAVGDSGTVLVSQDGTQWSVVRSLTSLISFRGIVFGHGRFVAVGYYPAAKRYEGIILNSLDGVTWNVSNIPAKSISLLAAVTYGKNLFVAVGESSHVLVSWDGLSWFSRPTGNTYCLSDVTYGNGTFVAVGYSDRGTVFTSQDGLRWTARPPGIADSLYGVAYGKDIFIAVGSDGAMILSHDGKEWGKIESGFTNLLYSVAFGNDTFVAVGYGLAITSHDGVTWQQTIGVTEWIQEFMNGVSFTNGVFITVGGHGRIYTSPDGYIWTNMRTWLRDDRGDPVSLQGFIYREGIFVGWCGSTILTSPDGASWTSGGWTGPYWIYGLAFGSGIYIAVGGGGSIHTSLDGITWNPTQLKIKEDLIGIAYGNGVFVTLNNKGDVFTSSDGEIWTETAYLNDIRMRGLVFGKGFLAWGQDSTFTSMDGVQWEQNTLGEDIHLEKMVYGKGVYVAVAGGLFTSKDGMNWQNIAAPGFATGVAFADNTFVVTAHNNVVETSLFLTSQDGESWTVRLAGTNHWLDGVAYGANTFFAFDSYYGIILRSDHLVGPRVSVHSASISFEDTTVGNTSEKDLLIRNEGTQALSMGIITDPTSYFQKVTDNCSQKILPPGESCDLRIRFTPLSRGVFFSRLAIPSNDPDNEKINIPITGTAEMDKSISLQSPAEGTLFDSCSLVTAYQPSFTWDPNGLFYKYTLLFSLSSSDFAPPLARAEILGSQNRWIPSRALWKKILKASWNNGSPVDVYWKVIGKGYDSTLTESTTKKFRIGDPLSSVVRFPEEGSILQSNTPPSFSFDSSCNLTFRLEFSPYNEFLNSRKITGFRFAAQDPNTTNLLSPILNHSQWTSVKRLLGLEGYFRVKAWDGLNRQTVSEVRAFAIKDDEPF